MVNDKSKANLAKGRIKGIKRSKPTANKCNTDNTWKAMYTAIGELPLTATEQAALESHGVTDEFLSVRGITHKKKFARALIQFIEAGSNPSMANLVMDRTEGKVKAELELSGSIGVKGYCDISPDDWDTADASGDST